MRVAFIIYTDFECLNIPLEGAPANPEKSSTNLISKQIPCSYCFVRVLSDKQAKDPVLQHFMDSVQDKLEEINDAFANPEKTVMSEEDQILFAEGADSHIGIAAEGQKISCIPKTMEK